MRKYLTEKRVLFLNFVFIFVEIILFFFFEKKKVYAGDVHAVVISRRNISNICKNGVTF